MSENKKRAGLGLSSIYNVNLAACDTICQALRSNTELNSSETRAAAEVTN